MYARNIILYLIICITLSSCHHSKTDLREEIEQFIGKTITFPEDLVGINLPRDMNLNEIINSKCKIVIYIDSIECSECKIRTLRIWEKLYQSSNYQSLPIITIFNTPYIKDLLYNIQVYNINYPFFIDGNNLFKEKNQFLPNQDALHTFLIIDGKVVLVGSPINNSQIYKLYQQELAKHKKQFNLK